MTPLLSRVPWAFALGMLLLSLTGCPRRDFFLGGNDGGAAGGGGSDTQSCGSRGQDECGDGKFCDFPESAICGAADGPGVCRDIPEACTQQLDPVCGCDGKTYGNECTAAAASVSVASQGECEDDTEPKSCGGLIGGGCDDGQYCNYAPDALCGAADATGVCTDKPEACAEIYKPVCGCDDKTYGNACEAASAGVSVVREGECEPTDPGGKVCGGLLGGQCARDEFCDYPVDAICGIADAPGVCEKIPSACTREFAPVCGCDGNTYNNECEANTHGVGIRARSACDAPSDRVCGVRGAAECEANEYCKYQDGTQCGAADEPGTCTEKPQACTLELAEVCGCDGQTYGNACAAAASGTSVAYGGACDTAGATCGGLIGAGCDDGQYCNFSEEAQCGAADQTGVCTDIPQACTKEYRPVCGCDDNTYGNACTAAAAGVSIASVGECIGGSGSGNTCGGLLGAGCPKGDYCNFSEEAQCGAADQTGTCAPIPEVCTADYTPVCGCDDMTYGNACAAAVNSVSVVHQGEC